MAPTASKAQYHAANHVTRRTVTALIPIRTKGMSRSPSASAMLSTYTHFHISLSGLVGEFTGLPCPLVTLHAAREELDGDVDLFFDLRRHVAHLAEGEDA